MNVFSLRSLLLPALGAVAIAGCAAPTQDDSAQTQGAPVTSVPGGAGGDVIQPVKPILPVHPIPIHPLPLVNTQSINGTDLTIFLNYEGKSASAPSDVNVLDFPFLSIPSATQTLLQTPLSTQFDTYWTTATAKAASPHDQFVSTLQSDIIKEVKSSMGNQYGPYGFDIAVPTSGSLSATLSGSQLTVTFDLGQVTANFTTTSPYSAASSPTRPSRSRSTPPSRSR